jgi:alcohol dehydrogenase
MALQAFQHVTPLPRLFYGANSLAQISRELQRLDCQRAVIFCGTSLARSDSTLDLVRTAVGERLVGVFAGVEAHTPLPAVQRATQELEHMNADAVIAVGGGSAVVTARAASILFAEKAEISSLCTRLDERGELHSPKLLVPKLPQLVIPTTPNTACVKAGTAVFDPVSNERLALFDPKTRAAAVFIHPDLVGSAPRRLINSASLDTLTLAIEGLLSRSANPLSDALLMHAIRLLSAHLSGEPLEDNSTVRCELVLAAVLCGQGTDSTGAGLATVLGHAIGARYGVENGAVKAIVMPPALRFNASAAHSGMGRLAAALGLPLRDGDDRATMVNQALERIFTRLGPRRLRDLAVPNEDLTSIAEQAMQDWFLRGNPRTVSDASVLRAMLEEAW